MSQTERKADVVGEYFDFLTERARLARNHDVKLAYEKAANRFRLVDAAMSELIERERIMQEALQRIARHTKNITGAPDMVAIAENGLALAARVQGGQ